MVPQVPHAYRKPESPHLMPSAERPLRHSWKPIDGGVVSMTAPMLVTGLTAVIDGSYAVRRQLRPIAPAGTGHADLITDDRRG